MVENGCDVLIDPACCSQVHSPSLTPLSRLISAPLFGDPSTPTRRSDSMRHDLMLIQTGHLERPNECAPRPRRRRYTNFDKATSISNHHGNTSRAKLSSGMTPHTKPTRVCTTSVDTPCLDNRQRECMKNGCSMASQASNAR